MKKSDRSSRAIIMCGISGSGKSHHALRLSAEGYIRLSVDTLAWQMASSPLTSLPLEERQALFAECRALIQNQLVKLLKRGKKVVVDATNCKRSVRDQIRQACAQAGVSPVFAYCIADKETLWSRLSKRKGTGPDDLIITYAELSEYWNGFEPPQPDETDFIHID